MVVLIVPIITIILQQFVQHVDLTHHWIRQIRGNSLYVLALQVIMAGLQAQDALAVIMIIIIQIFKLISLAIHVMKAH